jgi:Domain of unknown function (DUF222)
MALTPRAHARGGTRRGHRGLRLAQSSTRGAASAWVRWVPWEQRLDRLPQLVAFARPILPSRPPGRPPDVLRQALALLVSVLRGRHVSNMCSLAVEATGTGGGASGLADGRAAGLAALAVERLEGEITELAAHISAATCRWLLLVGEFDRREGWRAWGCRSCAQWLSYRCGLSPAAGREHVRVARRLAGLPAIRAAFGRGELCYRRSGR